MRHWHSKQGANPFLHPAILQHGLLRLPANYDAALLSCALSRTAHPLAKMKMRLPVVAKSRKRVFWNLRVEGSGRSMRVVLCSKAPMALPRGSTLRRNRNEQNLDRKRRDVMRGEAFPAPTTAPGPKTLSLVDVHAQCVEGAEHFETREPNGVSKTTRDVTSRATLGASAAWSAVCRTPSARRHPARANAMSLHLPAPAGVNRDLILAEKRKKVYLGTSICCPQF